MTETVALVLAYLAVMLCCLIAINWHFDRLQFWTDRAHRQRMAMIDHMAKASQTLDEWEEMVKGLHAVSLRKHAELLRRGVPTSEIYPAIVWGPAKAVEGVE